MLVAMRPALRTRVVASAVVLAAALGGAALLALDAARVFEVLGAYRLGAARPAGSSALQNWALISKIVGLGEGNGFLALAGVGILLGALSWWRATVALAAWPLAQLGLFLLYTDLADKHVVYLVPPLALLGGLAVGGIAVSAERLVVRRPRFSRTLTPGLVGLCATGFYLTSLATLWRADRDLARDAVERVRRDYDGFQEQAV